jgi:D-alanine-D-alanine ligase
MVSKTTRVGVLYGGMSSEREISLKTGKAVKEALASRGWDVVGIDVGRDLPAKLVEAEVGAAWIALHGRYGEDGCVQGLLEVMGIPYTGSGVRASSVAMDKISTKRLLRGVDGIVFAKDAVVHAGDPAPDLALPVILKPSTGGSTIGMGFVREASAWASTLARASQESADVLVEEVIVGDEITVAVLDGKALPVVRIVPDSGFFDFEAKYTKGKTTYEVPAKLPQGSAERAQQMAEAAYAAVGCRGLGRVDFIVRPDGTPVFLEVNTLPGMTATSLSPMAAGAVGISFEELCERLLLAATFDPT